MAAAVPASLFTLSINNQIVNIRSINISITGLELRQLSGSTGLQANDTASAASIDVSLRASELTVGDATSPNKADATQKDKKNWSVFGKNKKKSAKSPASTTSTPVAQLTSAGRDSLVTGPAAADGNGNESAGIGAAASEPPASVSMMQQQQQQQAPQAPALPPHQQQKQAEKATAFPSQPPPIAPKPLSTSPPRPLRDPPAAAPAVAVSGGGNDDDDSSDNEVDLTSPAISATVAGSGATVSAGLASLNAKVPSASNTVESDSNTCGSVTVVEPQQQKGDADKKQKKGKFSIFSSRTKDKPKKEKPARSGSVDMLNFSFPQDLPDNVKELFMIPSDLRKPIAIVYASGEGRTDPVKQQKRLLTETAEKRFIVDGKSRSVWLDPEPGEQMEVWKQYYNQHNEANRALARILGSEKYGYIVADEVDQKKEFATRQEKQEYQANLEKVEMLQGVYDDDDDEQPI